MGAFAGMTDGACVRNDEERVHGNDEKSREDNEARTHNVMRA